MKCSCQAHGSWPPPWIRGCRAPHANEQRFVRRKEDVPWTMFHGFKSSRETVAATIRMAAPTKPTASASETTEIPMAASNGNSHSNINTILRTRPKTTALEHVSQWEASMGCKQMETKMQGKQAVGDSHFQVISPAQALLVSASCSRPNCRQSVLLEASASSMFCPCTPVAVVVISLQITFYFRIFHVNVLAH